MNIKYELLKQKIMVAAGVFSIVGSTSIFSAFGTNPNIFIGIIWFILSVIGVSFFIYREEKLNKLIEEITSKNSNTHVLEKKK